MGANARKNAKKRIRRKVKRKAKKHGKGERRSHGVILISGPPGSGKGTVCRQLAHSLGLLHLSTGDIFRDAVLHNTPLGQQAKPYLDKAQFVPDELVTKLVLERLAQADRGVLLDGFPRTRKQARELTEQVDIERFLLLQCRDDVCVERVQGRSMDPRTGEIYHSSNRPPPAALASHLVVRQFDRDQSKILARVHLFHGQLGVILPFFAGKIQVVNGARDMAAVRSDVIKSLTVQMAPSPPRPIASNPSPPSVPEPPVASGPKPVEEKTEKKAATCSVCLDAPAVCLVAPCGHQCGCDDCLSTIQRSDGACPICRGPIQAIIRVFMVDGENDDEAEQAGGEGRLAPMPFDNPRPAVGGEEGGEGVAQGWGPDVPRSEHNAGSSQSGEGGGREGCDPREITVTVLPCEDVLEGEGVVSHIAVAVDIPDPPQGVRRVADYALVIDISGSMSELATYQDDNDPDSGVLRSDGMTILDLVKHAVKTVLHTLTERDRVALVAFDTFAEVVFPLQAMTKDGRTSALAALERLQPRAQTNIWGGLLNGLEAIRDGRGEAGNKERSVYGDDDEHRNKCVMLLTDGRPNISPPRGHVAELEAYRSRKKGFEFQVNTFGFGYTVDSDLLSGLAVAGNGTYSFIPDAKILGTCFVNCVANCGSCLDQSAKLHLSPLNGASFAGNALGGLPETLTHDGGMQLSLGPLQWGQRRDVVIPMRITQRGKPYLLATLVRLSDNGGALPATGEEGKGAFGVGSALELQPTGGAVCALVRAELVTTGLKAVNDAANSRGQAANRDWITLVGRVLGHQTAAAAAGAGPAGPAAAYLEGLHADVSGRMAKALTTPERFARWGKHYLLSLLRAHQIQHNTNFMDVGLQRYGGEVFTGLRDIGGDTFVTIPRWRASGAEPPRQAHQGRARGAPASAPAPARVRTPSPDMQDYYAGSGGGCFAPSSQILVCPSDVATRASWLSMSKVVKGDRVLVADGGLATVLCVVRFARGHDRPLVVVDGGLCVTGGHPVQIQGVWLRARDLIASSTAERVANRAGFVYNLLLDRCHVLVASGSDEKQRVLTVTLGHGLEGEVLSHPFFADHRVVSRTLTRQAGFQAGFVQL